MAMRAHPRGRALSLPRRSHGCVAAVSLAALGAVAALTGALDRGTAAFASGLCWRDTRRPLVTIRAAPDSTQVASKEGSLAQILTDNDAVIEADRRYRRPVFDYQQWKRHRSTERFTRNLRSLLTSQTIRACWQEVLLVTMVALAVCFWNDFDFGVIAPVYDLKEEVAESVKEVTDFFNSRPQLGLPALPFTVSSFPLSLLLVFRTNQAYARWWEARCVWGAIINRCRDVVRQAMARFRPEDLEGKAEVTRLVSAYPRCLIFHVGERTDLSVKVLDEKLGDILTDDEREKLMKCTHKPMTLCGMLTKAIRRGAPNSFDQMRIDEDLTAFTDFYGMCERIFKTPMPLSFTRLTTRFLGVYLLTLPLALFGVVTPHWAIVPISCALAFFIFGVDEVGVQLEEPFSVLPMGAMADGIDASIFEALELDRRKVIKGLGLDPDVVEKLRRVRQQAATLEKQVDRISQIAEKAAANMGRPRAAAPAEVATLEAPHEAAAPGSAGSAAAGGAAQSRAAPAPERREPARQRAPARSDFHLGQRVLWNGKREGTVQYIGETGFAAGEWVGVALDEADGMHEGTVAEVTYFACEENHGVFCRRSALQPAGQTEAEAEAGGKPAGRLAAEQRLPRARPAAVRTEEPVRAADPQHRHRPRIRVGQTVTWRGGRHGTVRYVGKTKFASGEDWVGVELDEPLGMHNGTVMGVPYFRCKPKHGVFCQAAQVEVAAH